MRRRGGGAAATSMARLLALVLTALDLIRVMGVVGSGPVMGLDWDRTRGLGSVRVLARGLARILGLGLDQVRDRAFVSTTVRGPITALVSDHRAAPLALLRLPTIRLSNTEPSATVVDFAKSNRGLRPSF